MKGTILFCCLNLLNLVNALECPPKDESIPLCPQSGSTLLDDTYPVQAYVISNHAQRRTNEAEDVPLNFMETIADSYSDNHYKNLPQMIFSTGNEGAFHDLKTDLKKRLLNKNVSQSDIDKIIGQMTFREQGKYTWQQDYFESFFDPSTGSPVLRKVGDYDTKMKVDTGKVEDIAKTGQACGIKSGDELKGDPKSLSINGEMGGNIEGAPGGFCLVGDNQGNNYTKSFCKSDDNIIQVQTSWLTVGHVDELFKIIPTDFADGRPKECQFSLMAASPKRAIELMKTPQYGKDHIFDYNPRLTEKEVDEYFANKPSPKTAYGMCKYIEQIHKDKGAPSPNGNSNPGAARSVFFNVLSLIFSDSYAGVVRPKPNPQVDLCLQGMKEVTNYDLASKMTEDDNFNKLNNTIQESIDKDTALIKEKILSRLPQCKNFFDVIEVPNIFSSLADPIKINPNTNKLELKQNAMSINSIYPNPSNSVVMNKTILFPNPENKAFSSYLGDEMKKRGLKYKSVNTWDYAHVGDGNIHCSSHTLNHCRANK